jgi:hypothetical protein
MSLLDILHLVVVNTMNEVLQEAFIENPLKTATLKK